MPDELRLIVGRVEAKLEAVSHEVERGTELAATLGKSIGEIVQRLSSIEQSNREQRSNVDKFWDIHWPSLLHEVKKLSEGKLDREIFEAYRIYVDRQLNTLHNDIAGIKAEVTATKSEVHELSKQFPRIEESVYKSAAQTRTIVLLFMIVAMFLHDGLREWVFDFAKKLI